MKKWFLGIAALASVAFFSARAAGTLEPRTAFRLVVTYGDRTTEFSLNPTSSDLRFRFDGGKTGVRKLSRGNADYLRSRVEQVPPALEADGSCDRRAIYLDTRVPGKEPQRASACLGEASATAKDLQSLADLLATVL